LRASISLKEHAPEVLDVANEQNQTDKGKQQKKQTTSLSEKLRLVRQENLNAAQQKEKVFGHFLSHIPKTGGFYALDQLNTLIQKNPQWKNLDKHEKFQACMAGLLRTTDFDEKYPSKQNGMRCSLWMSERPHTMAANHVYTIIRNPQTHVLSQYFHCTESKSHETRAHLMPSLGEWLEAHVKHYVQHSNTTSKLPKYECYNPFNMQSRYASFNKSTTLQELQERYTVIGDQAQMDKTLCVIFVHYTGFFPPQCNCTAASHRRLSGFDHGVTHHGDTFDMTPNEKKAIDALTQVDAKLYRMAKQNFGIQVKEIEKEFGVKLCDKIKD
jgi:hypothetical protein